MVRFVSAHNMPSTEHHYDNAGLNDWTKLCMQQNYRIYTRRHYHDFAAFSSITRSTGQVFKRQPAPIASIRIKRVTAMVLYIEGKRQSKVLRPDQTRMRVATLALVWPPTLINSHALSSTLSWFQVWLVWPIMRVCTLQLQAQIKWPMFLSVFLTLGKNQKQAMSLPIMIIRRGKIYIITYHRQATVGVMTRTVSSLTSVKKRMSELLSFWPT